MGGHRVNGPAPATRSKPCCTTQRIALARNAQPTRAACACSFLPPHKEGNMAGKLNKVDTALAAIRDEIRKQLPNVEGDVWHDHLERSAKLIDEEIRDRAMVAEKIAKHEAERGA